MLVEARAAGLKPRTLLSVAWAAHQAQAFDISFELFLRGLPGQTGNPKLLGAIQRAALLAGRGEALLKAYEELAEQAPNLYGRMKTLEKKLAEE